MTKHKKMTKEEQKANLIAGSKMYNIKPDYTLLILAAIVAIGATFRIYHLDYNSIWLDEAATYIHSLTLSGIFDYTNSVDYFNPPLFPLFEFVMIQIAGASEWGLRFFPALFGILTIPAAYLMGKEFHDKYTGLITAIIFALSPFLIYYSQEARSFSMLLFLCTVLMYVFLKALKTNSRKDWAAFGIVAAVTFATHFWSSLYCNPRNIRSSPVSQQPQRTALWTYRTTPCSPANPANSPPLFPEDIRGCSDIRASRHGRDCRNPDTTCWIYRRV